MYKYLIIHTRKKSHLYVEFSLHYKADGYWRDSAFPTGFLFQWNNPAGNFKLSYTTSVIDLNT